MKKKPKRQPQKQPDYQEPVAQLLKLGLPDQKWLDYATLGLSKDDAKPLMLLALDGEIFYEGDEPDAYGPIHAWRALGQLQITEAAPVLILAFMLFDDSDWISEEMPDVFTHLGPETLLELVAFMGDEEMGDEDNEVYPLMLAASCIEAIGKKHRTARADCVAALTAQLEKHETNAPDVNGNLVAALIELDASEALPVIDRAFRAGNVDTMICGDLKDVRAEFGLLPPGEKPPPKFLGSKNPFLGF